MLHLYLNAKEIVDRPVLITYMLGNDADESESLSDDQLKDKGIIIPDLENLSRYA